MDRQQFLRSACGMGVCGCAVGVLALPEAAKAEEAKPADRRLGFVKHQVAKMTGFMAASDAATACTGILEQTGRECAKLGQLGVRFKGNPQGYLAEIKKAWGTDSSWDEKAGLITVAVPEGDCGCPLADPKSTPAFWCSCSVGYQKESFEAVFGKPVQVRLKESKLAGSKRCTFEVRLA